jgi:hypothetical protein
VAGGAENTMLGMWLVNHEEHHPSGAEVEIHHIHYHVMLIKSDPRNAML